jgi:dipeptidyl aminopeptidase/acylaminoacyl peptidase
MARQVVRAFVLLACFFCFSSFGASVEDTAKRPFTVAESIAWSSVINFQGDLSANPRSGTALFSPDGSRFLLHVRRGSLDDNAIVDRLLLYEASAVRKYLSSGTDAVRPAARVLVQLSAKEERSLVSHVQWLSSTEIGFLAAGADGVPQAFVVDAVAGRTSQVTHSQTPVVAFAAGGGRILFLAHARPRSRPLIGVVENSPIGAIMMPAAPDSTPLELFTVARTGGEPQRIHLPAMNLFEPFRRLWVSPRGTYGLAFVPATDAPAHWADYQIPEYDSYGYTPARLSSDPTSFDLIFRSRYVLVNLLTGDARPLLDAPSGWIAQNLTPIEAFWADDETTIVVTNTYLPLTEEDETTRPQRMANPAIAEVDLTSGQSTAVFWEPVLRDDDRVKSGGRMPWRIWAVDWDHRRHAIVITKRIRTGDTFAFQSQSIRKIRGEWRASRAIEQRENDLSIDLRQGLNERPVVYGSRLDVRKILFDPNPQAEQLRFGRVEAIRWSDTDSMDWRGGVVYPPDYVAGKRYPLVVQTHGFDPDQFLVDGPAPYGSTAMAAQSLANAGFVVLQVEDKPITDAGREGPMMANGYYAGIQHLITQGIADRDRVGLIAFSRTGVYALHLLARHPLLLKAVTLADSVQIGYVTQVLTTNLPAELVLQMHAMAGGAPELDHIGEWFAGNPLYKLPQAKAAVRIESNDLLDSLLGLWETYALLRTARRPVEFVYFPEGSHVQTRPLERMGSQDGNVDWFRFWLLNQQSDDPGKAAQYRRWRQLRELH